MTRKDREDLDRLTVNKTVQFINRVDGNHDKTRLIVYDEHGHYHSEDYEWCGAEWNDKWKWYSRDLLRVLRKWEQDERET
jgi:hypothetical protein